MKNGVPPEEQSHFRLGTLIRNALPHRRPSEPLPLVPSALRLELQSPRRPSLRVWAAGGGLGALAIVAGVAVLRPDSPDTLRYAVESGPAKADGSEHTRIRFSDGSEVLADRATRVRVASLNGSAARLHLDEGVAQIQIAGQSAARWSVEAGPFAVSTTQARLDLSWSAAQGTISVALLSGAAVVSGPFARGESPRIAPGETLIARASDGFWRLHSGSMAAAAKAQVASLIASRTDPRRCRDRKPHEEVGSEAWVSLDQNGCLAYGRDAHGNRVPDFSHAGYGGGGVPLPFVPRAAGSVSIAPGTSGDDTPTIQAALDDAGARPADGHGFRAAVELASGTFILKGTLHILDDGVVLRGQGTEGPGATVLRAVGTGRPVVMIGPDEGRGSPRAAHRVAEAYVPVGARSFELDDATGLQVGDDIVVQRSFSPRWLSLVGLDSPGRRGMGTRLGRGLGFERRVAAIDGRHITIDVPLTNALDREYGDTVVGKYGFEARIERAGVERLAGRADFDPHSDLGNGIFIQANAVANGWIRQVRGESFQGGTVNLEQPSKWITVEEASYVAPSSSDPEGWSRAFLLGGQQNLLYHSRSVGARHALNTWSRAAGPNVVLDFTVIGESLVTPSRWTNGLLLDGVRITDSGGEPSGIVLMYEKPSGKSAGWSAANSVVWNSAAARFLIDNPPTAQNWVIGAAGESSGTGHFDTTHASRPDSLYRAQLAERLGDAAVAVVSR